MHLARPSLHGRPGSGRSLPRDGGTVTSAAAALVLLTAGPASAHEAWFVEHPSSYPLDWSALASPATLAGVVVALLLTVAWRASPRGRRSPSSRPCARCSAWSPGCPGCSGSTWG